MSDELRSTAIGWITGLGVAIVKNDIVVAVITAFLTGGAAHTGQIVLKNIHARVKVFMHEWREKHQDKTNL
jgi:predicted thioredoxin/glutaredoxin